METAAIVLTDATSKEEEVEEDTSETFISEDEDEDEADDGSTSTFHIESQLEHLESLLNQAETHAEAEVSSPRGFNRTQFDTLITNVDSGDLGKFLDGTTSSNILDMTTSDNILEMLGFSDNKLKNKEHACSDHKAAEPDSEEKEGEKEDSAVVTEMSETDTEKDLGTEDNGEENCPVVHEQKEVAEDSDGAVEEAEPSPSEESVIDADCADKESEAVVDSDVHNMTDNVVEVKSRKKVAFALEVEEKEISKDEYDELSKDEYDEEEESSYDESFEDEGEESSDDAEVVIEEHEILFADADQNTPAIEVSEKGVTEDNKFDAEQDNEEEKLSTDNEIGNTEMEANERKDEEPTPNEEITAEEYDKLWRNENNAGTEISNTGMEMEQPNKEDKDMDGEDKSPSMDTDQKQEVSTERMAEDKDMDMDGEDKSPSMDTDQKQEVSTEGMAAIKSSVVDGVIAEETEDSASVQEEIDTKEDEEGIPSQVGDGSDGNGNPKEAIGIDFEEQEKEADASTDDNASTPTVVDENVSVNLSLVHEDQEIVTAASDGFLSKTGRYFTDLKNEVLKLRDDYDRVQANNKRLSQANTSAGASFESLNEHAQLLQKKLEQSEIEVKEANAALTETKTVVAELRDELAMKKASYVAEVHSRLSYQKTLQEVAGMVQSECTDSAFVEKILALVDKAESEAMAVPTLKPTDESSSVADSTCATEETPTANNKSKQEEKAGYMAFIKACGVGWTA